MHRSEYRQTIWVELGLCVWDIKHNDRGQRSTRLTRVKSNRVFSVCTRIKATRPKWPFVWILFYPLGKVKIGLDIPYTHKTLWHVSVDEQLSTYGNHHSSDISNKGNKKSVGFTLYTVYSLIHFRFNGYINNMHNFQVRVSIISCTLV